MNGINRVFIMGYLGSDPELQTSKTGKAFLRLNIATHYTKRIENGDPQDTTTWHRITVWGKSAERCQNYLHKGSPLAVEGYLSKSSSTREDGTESSFVSIVAREVHFIGSRKQVAPPEAAEDRDDGFMIPSGLAQDQSMNHTSCATPS